MAFQRGTSASSNGCRDILVSLQAFLTSKHISAAVINGGGAGSAAGYVAGDILTITHAGAYHDATIEVLTVDGGGGILTFVIRDNGSFANRVATVAINTTTTTGSGYDNTEYVRLTDGSYTEFCKIEVTSVAGVPSSVSIFETGGAYTTAPSLTDIATDADIGQDSGTGLRVDITMTSEIGTTAIAATGGTGSGATFDLTLTATGWSMIDGQQNQNNYEDTGVTNGRTDEKEMILQGTVAGGDDPYIGIRSYRGDQGVDTRYGWMFAGMDNYSSSLTFDFQVNIGPGVSGANNPSDNDNPCLLMYDDAQDWWFQADGRQFKVVIKAVGTSSTSYTSSYTGLLNPFGTQTEVPYAMYLAATTTSYIRSPDSLDPFITGITEGRSEATSTCPYFFRNENDASWTQMSMSVNNLSRDDHVLDPMGVTARSTNNSNSEYLLSDDGSMVIHMDDNTITLETGGVATELIMPTIGDNEIVLFPITLLSTPNTSNDNNAETLIRGELAGVFWHGNTDSSGNALAAEDTIDSGGFRHYNFPNAERSRRYSFFALRAE